MPLLMSLTSCFKRQPRSPEVTQSGLTANLNANHRTRNTRLSMLLVMLMTLLISLVGLNTAPIEGHEIFVVQTAREMRVRGDWVVPWFNDQPRLNKPPLNYWLTAAVSMAAGDNDVLPWHGRLVSATGGILIVAMTLWIASMLGSSSMSITAGLLAATSVGYLMFSHDGRPDMLYASLCTVMIALWLYAWQSLKHKKNTASTLASYGMWIALALATLSKGPHIPLLFLAIFLIITWSRERSIKQCFKVFHPISGMALALVLILPWWLLLYSRIGQDLFHSQLAGKRYGMDILAMANPYYFYRTFIVILPWCLLWVFAGIALRQKNTQGRSARLLFTIVLLTLIVLSLATGKRLVYVIPLLAPMSILMAMGANQLISTLRHDDKLSKLFGLWHTVIYTAITLILIVITTTMHAHRLIDDGLLWIPILGVIGATTTGVLVVRMSRRFLDLSTWQSNGRSLTFALRGAAVIFAWFLLVAGAAATSQNTSRWQYKDNALLVREQVPKDAQLYSLGVHSHPFVYYMSRPVHELASVQEFEDAMNSFHPLNAPNDELPPHSPIFLITTHKAAARLQATAIPPNVTTLMGDNENQFELLHVHPLVSDTRWARQTNNLKHLFKQNLREY